MLAAAEADDALVAADLRSVQDRCQLGAIDLLFLAVSRLVAFLAAIMAYCWLLILEHRVDCRAGPASCRTNLLELNPVLLIGKVGQQLETALLVNDDRLQVLLLAVRSVGTKASHVVRADLLADELAILEQVLLYVLRGKAALEALVAEATFIVRAELAVGKRTRQAWESALPSGVRSIITSGHMINLRHQLRMGRPLDPPLTTSGLSRAPTGVPGDMPPRVPGVLWRGGGSAGHPGPPTARENTHPPF